MSQRETKSERETETVRESGGEIERDIDGLYLSFKRLSYLFSP